MAEQTKTKRAKLPLVVTNKQTIQTMMDLMGPQLQIMLPKFIDARKLLAVLLSACQRQPLLFQCSTRSFIGALLECAMVGLYPDGSLGHAWFIPFKDKRGQYHAQLIIGYKGYQTLALNTGQVNRIKAVSVHKGDEFIWEEGLNAKIIHRPTGEDRGKNTLTHVYAYAKLKADPDDPQFVVLTRQEIDRVMNSSKAGTRGPWGEHYVAMGRKTAINRVCNMLQLSPDLSRAATLDDMAASGINQKLGVSPLLQEIGAHLELPEPEFDQEDDAGMVETVDLPTALPKGQRQSEDQGQAQGQQRGPKGQQDGNQGDQAKPAAAAADDQAPNQPAQDEPPADPAPETAIAAPQGVADGPDAGQGTSGDMFPDGPPAGKETPNRRKRAWKPTKRMIDTAYQTAMANEWTTDQVDEYAQEIFSKGLAALDRGEYDSLMSYVEENKPF